MMTTFSLSHTWASWPKCFLNTPIVPGPHTSCVIRTSTFTHTLSFGFTWSRPAARARIFSVRVIAAMWRLSLGGLTLVHQHCKGTGHPSLKAATQGCQGGQGCQLWQPCVVNAVAFPA